MLPALVVLEPLRYALHALPPEEPNGERARDTAAGCVKKLTVEKRKSAQGGLGTMLLGNESDSSAASAAPAATATPFFDGEEVGEAVEAAVVAADEAATYSTPVRPLRRPSSRRSIWAASTASTVALLPLLLPPL
jgi:hypothetical protein